MLHSFPNRNGVTTRGKNGGYFRMVPQAKNFFIGVKKHRKENKTWQIRLPLNKRLLSPERNNLNSEKTYSETK